MERAASVLKELIENSLDAGAKRIDIIIKGHGRELIQVVDDGCGMSRNNLHLAFERHATSKLSKTEDLQRIQTLGFRGEALPSIASVSYVEIRSCSSDATTGTLLRLEGGTLIHEEPTPSVPGTSLSVHSLFFNTPARARFLKSPATELAHLIRTFKQYALAYPEIAWSFTHGASTEYTLPASSFMDRLNDLFGIGFSEKVLALDYDMGGFRIKGAVGKPELNKKSRGDQYIFLNHRPVQNMLVHSAVRAAMREQLNEGEWPFYVILLGVPPSEADINVHPAKLEVKFASEQIIHAAVYRAIRAALPKQLADDPIIAPVQPNTSQSLPVESPGLFDTAIPLLTSNEPPQLSANEPPVTRDLNLLRPAMFQVHEKYLISQIQSGIAIIDQHAAHERILYEKALRSFTERMFNSQQLLFPILLELEPEEDAVFQEVHADLKQLGFQIREFGQRTYSIEAVPAGLKRVSEIGMIRSMLEEYVEFRQAKFEPRDALAAGFACHAAIRTGDTLTPEEMSALVDELFATKFPLTCPHGRPTVIHIKLSELDRRFKRTE